MRLDPLSRRLVQLALEEDLGSRGDVTTRAFLPRARRYRATLVAKAAGVFCGAAAASEVFRQVSPRIQVIWRTKDGQRVRPGQIVARLKGPRELLTAERTALNFLQHLSGIATLTRAYADTVRGTRARVFDTRKTTPGLRALEKYAVRCGGGFNHRQGLYDMALVKDNHLAALSSVHRPAKLRVPLEVEAKTHRQVELALAMDAHIVLLDNMGPTALKREIRFLRSRHPKIKIEVSGGVTLSNIRRIAKLGPDRISVGRLTHSAPALDMSLELER